MSDGEISILEKEIEHLLFQVAFLKDFQDSQIHIDANAIRGDGFMGEFFFGSVKNRETNEEVHVAIKKAKKSQQRSADGGPLTMYKNEVFFYTKVFPAFQELQKRHDVKEPFDNIPEFYCANLTEPNESVVLENLKIKGYDVIKKEDLLDDEHARLVFKTYGKFHALSFALKDQNPEKYRELIAESHNFCENSLNDKTFTTLLTGICSRLTELLDPVEDAEIITVSRKYLIDPVMEFGKVMNYDGENDVFNHGDCWTANDMFRYSGDGKLEDMKLIDFQLLRRGTPVYDLSYFFYTSGSKALFDNLDEYLKVYHASLSQFLLELGSDPEKLYPFSQLKTEWKKYALFGVLFSVLLVKLKLLQKKDVDTIVDDKKEKEEKPSFQLLSANVNEDLFKKRSRDILESAVKEGIMQ